MIYQTADGQTSVNVRLENDTVWLTQAQMVELFQKDQSVVARHIRNVFKEGELDEKSNMQILHNTFSKYKPTAIYSLDVIISVGYRVKSQRGTQFRIWANRVLKDYLIKGYALSDRVSKENYDELRRLLQLTGRTLHNLEEISGDESRSLLDVVVDYAYALDTLDRYDYQQLSISHTTRLSRFRATYEGAMQAIRSLRDKFGGSMLFGNEKDGSFKSSIGQIYQIRFSCGFSTTTVFSTIPTVPNA